MGFIAVVIGRAQLFTENTLYPVVLVFENPRWIRDTLRLWSVVFVCNVLGALAFALVAERTAALNPKAAQELVDWAPPRYLAMRASFSGAASSAAGLSLWLRGWFPPVTSR